MHVNNSLYFGSRVHFIPLQRPLCQYKEDLCLYILIRAFYAEIIVEYPSTMNGFSVNHLNFPSFFRVCYPLLICISGNVKYEYIRCRKSLCAFKSFNPIENILQ